MVIIGSKTGQLANRLFAFAHFIANSIEYNYTLYNPAFDEYKKYFSATLNDDFDKYPIHLTLNIPVPVSLLQRITKIGSKVLPNSKYHRFLSCTGTNERFDLNDTTFIKDARNKLVITNGWLLRDELNFRKHADVIRNIFTPTNEILNNVEGIIRKCRANSDILVGVHIRKGDYKNWKDGIYYYNNETYREKMLDIESNFKKLGKSVTFLVCSNEAIKHEDFRNLAINSGSKHLVEDLYSLSKCNYIIGPPSTFSMWASFHGETPLLHIKDPDQKMLLENFSICRGSMPL